MKIIPKHYQEIEELYKQVRSENAHCITLISANGQEGTTSLTLSLAERLIDAQKNVLVIDLNHCQPFKLDYFGVEAPKQSWCFEDISCQTNVMTVDNLDLLSVQSLDQLAEIRDPVILQEAIFRLRQEYDYILLDMSPALRVNRANVPLHVIATCTDLTLVCVALGKNTEEDICNTQHMLQKAGLNKSYYILQQQYLPPLGPLLIQTIQEKCLRFPKLAQWLLKQVRNKAFLFRCP